ncbi:MAG: hypothetical protein QXG05_08075 [Nitrososphaerota archaeon]
MSIKEDVKQNVIGSAKDPTPSVNTEAPRREKEILKQMRLHGVGPLDVTEGDTWVNDATREDINNIAKEYNYEVFGLQMWTWEKVKGKSLINAPNFSVDYIFRNQDESKVYSSIKRYRRTHSSLRIINELAALSIYGCFWV